MLKLKLQCLLRFCLNWNRMKQNVFIAFGSRQEMPVVDYPVTESDIVVEDGLTYSVADMVDLVNKGLPVNAVNVNSMALQSGQGVPNPTWDVDPTQVRGYDIADAWETQQLARNKLADFYKSNKKLE